MNSYRYRITVEALTGAKGEPVQGRQLTFEAANHDDILAIVDRMRSKLPFSADAVASLGIGLKLFSEVALVHRTEPMFDTIRPALREFVQNLKQMSQLEPQESVGRLL
jgi:hypothetical protein